MEENLLVMGGHTTTAFYTCTVIIAITDMVKHTEGNRPATGTSEREGACIVNVMSSGGAAYHTADESTTQRRKS